MSTGKYKRTIRPIRFLTDVAVIELTKGQFAIIDIDNVHKVDDRNWYANTSKTRGSYYANGWVPKVNGTTQKMIRMHSVILSVPDGMQVDHINQNTMDNRQANLRPATRGQNKQNSKLHSNNTNGYTGVFKSGRRFAARIYVEGILKYLGLYITAEEAARAYDNAARIHHGEFAKVNFPDE